MDELIEIFINHIPYDKEFVEQLMPRYEEEFKLLGNYIKKHSIELWCKDTPDMQELLDFLDGNGFNVEYPEIKIPWDPNPVKLIPVYKTTLVEELDKINEKLKEAVEKMQSAFSEYVPISYDVLYDTSMEMDSRPILEYSELSTPRPLWICLHRCLEFLRLVSAGWGGRIALSRPP